MSDIEVTNRLIDVIQEAVTPREFEINGTPFSSKPLYHIPEKDNVEPIEAGSLTAVVDYCKGSLDADARGDIAIVVVDPATVRVIRGVKDSTDNRWSPLVAEADLPNLPIGGYTDLETIVIGLQSSFVETPGRADLIGILGNIVASEELRLKDDGMSQETVTRKGVRSEATTISNPHLLKPFRTFAEVDQPESAFIVRLQKSGENAIRAAILEADGGAWRNTARLAIKAWLEEALNVNGTALPILA